MFQHYQGNLEAASNVYKEALEMAAMKKMTHSLSILYVHFSWLKYMVGDISTPNFSTLQFYQFLHVLSVDPDLFLKN